MRQGLRQIFAATMLLSISRPTSAHEFSEADKAAIKRMVTSNISPIVARPPVVEKPIPPREDSMLAGAVNILMEEGLTGSVAYAFLKAILNLPPASWTVYADAIEANLERWDLNAQDQLWVRSRLAGAPARGLRGPWGQGKVQASGDASEQPVEVFDALDTFLASLPVFFPGKQKLVDAARFTHELILPDAVSDCYESSPDCVWQRSQGLIYNISRTLETDETYFLDALRFYARLAQVDRDQPYDGGFSVFDTTDRSVWRLALEATNGVKVRALRVLEVYGHDQCCNSVQPVNSGSALEISFYLLNEISPTANSGDAPHSLMHAPGSLGGVGISSNLKSKFAQLVRRYETLDEPLPTLSIGYYHVLGGLLTGTELLVNGFSYVDGVKLSTMISEGLGYYYKKFTMTKWMTRDARVLWESVNHDERAVPAKPEPWDDDRYERALLSLDHQLLYLELTREQHRQGANFVYSLFSLE